MKLQLNIIRSIIKNKYITASFEQKWDKFKINETNKKKQQQQKKEKKETEPDGMLLENSSIIYLQPYVNASKP